MILVIKSILFALAVMLGASLVGGFANYLFANVSGSFTVLSVLLFIVIAGWFYVGNRITGRK